MAECHFKLNQSITSPNKTVAISSSGILAITLHGVFSTIGIIENLLIVGVVGFRVRRTVISVWILNLAASDLLATAFLPFFTLYMARGNTWTLGTVFCRIYSSIFFLNMFVSGFLLAAISLDRCLVVMRPVWAQNFRDVQLVGKICALIWALAIICTIPFYVFRDTILHPSGSTMCYYNYLRFPPSGQYNVLALCKQRKEALVIMKLIMAFLIPLLIIIFSYIVVSYHLARRGSRPSYRFVRLVVSVVVTFFLCWAPYHLFILMEVMAPKGGPVANFATKGLHIAATIGFLNSVLNPVLYVFSCPDLCRKIKHSLSAVMESVLAEDLAELSRRRSTACSFLGAREVAQQPKTCTETLNLNLRDQHDGSTTNSD